MAPYSSLSQNSKGQLPKWYVEGPNATQQIPTDMNDRNIEEPTRYVEYSISTNLYPVIST